MSPWQAAADHPDHEALIEIKLATGAADPNRMKRLSCDALRRSVAECAPAPLRMHFGRFADRRGRNYSGMGSPKASAIAA